MKKLLLGSTALVAAGMVAGTGSPAQAAEPIQLSLGGYYSAYVIVREQDDLTTGGAAPPPTHLRPVDVNLEGEVFFKGETTLDNGIKVGVNVQLEAYTKGDQIDEHYVYFSGNFGRLVVGAENSAAYTMHYSAPGGIAHHGLDSPNLFTMKGESGNAAGAGTGSPVTTPIGISGDANKVTYFTPRFSPGFQFGASYTPDSNDANGGGGSGGGRQATDSDDPGASYGHLVAVGVNFVRTIGSVDVAWSAGYEHGELEESDGPGASCTSSTPFTTAAATSLVGTITSIGTLRTAIASAGAVGPAVTTGCEDIDEASTGFQIGVGGWTVGGAFQWSDQGTSADDTDSFEMVGGVTYGAGPWVVGAQGAYAWDEDGVAGDTDTVIAGEVGGTYTLGPGVKIAGGIQAWRGSGDEADEDFDGVAGTIGTTLSF